MEADHESLDISTTLNAHVNYSHSSPHRLSVDVSISTQMSIGRQFTTGLPVHKRPMTVNRQETRHRRSTKSNPGNLTTPASPGLKIATSLSRSRPRAELNDEGAKISSRVGSRSRDCGTVGDRAACSYRAERWETAAFVEFRGYASVGLRACGNCHSNHTDWPWYSHVAPVSWWITQHVREGREKLDFSDWERYSAWQKRDKLDSMCGLISTGKMPPWLYTTMHAEAQLTEEDKNAVCAWVKEQTVAAR
jgi:Haem-binding domain